MLKTGLNGLCGTMMADQASVHSPSAGVREMDLADFTGAGAIDGAYRVMMEHDAHAPGSVDRVLAAGMVKLCSETAEVLYSSFTPLEVRYAGRSRPRIEAILDSICSRAFDVEQRLEAIAEFTMGLGDGAEQCLDAIRIGGTEEEIVERRSDWCTDVARVACVLSQVDGYPCRLAYLFDLDHAYSGHVIVEAHCSGRWGALDPSTGTVFRAADGLPASIWESMRESGSEEGQNRSMKTPCFTPVCSRAAGIANYSVWESHRYDYTVTGLNGYYSSILDMAGKGWPGGLRWLHGENGEEG